MVFPSLHPLCIIVVDDMSESALASRQRCACVLFRVCENDQFSKTQDVGSIIEMQNNYCVKLTDSFPGTGFTVKMEAFLLHRVVPCTKPRQRGNDRSMIVFFRR